MKRFYSSTLILLALLLSFCFVSSAVFAAEQSGKVPDEYVQKLLAYVGTKTVEGKTLVYYRLNFDNIALVVCTINPNKPTSCDVVAYSGFPDKSMYEFYKNSKNAFSDDQRKLMTFVDEMQCYYIQSENESLGMRQNLSAGDRAVIVR